MYDFLLTFGVLEWVITGFFYVRKPVASMYHPMTYYLLIHGLIFVIRPIVCYVFNYDGVYIFYDFIPSMEEKNAVLVAADIGLIAFAIPCLRIGETPFQDMMRSTGVVVDSRARRAFLIVCAACLPFSVYSLASTLRGTANVMQMDQATGIMYNVSGNGYFYDAQLMTGTICVVLAWVFRFRIWAFVPLLIYIIAKASTGGRGPFIQAFIAVGILYFYNVKRKWPSIKSIVPVIAIVLLFSVIGSNREVVRDAFTGNEVASRDATATQRPLEGMDYANMEYFEFIVHVIPNRTGTYGYFLDNLQLVTEPIPRVLWRGKPLGAPIQMFDLFAYGRPIGMTSSVPGEGWAQAGWFGVVFWCAMFGAVYGWIYRVFAQSRGGVVNTSIYAIFMAASFVNFRDGVLLTIVKSSLFTLLPLIIWSIILKYSRQEEGNFTQHHSTARR